MTTAPKMITASSDDDGVKREPWDLVHAVDVLRQVEALVRPHGLFTCMTGGVLYRGRSSKDLDLVVGQLSVSRSGFPYGSLRDVLVALGWKCIRTAEQIRAWREANEGAQDRGRIPRHIEVWVTSENRRVDLFIWSEWLPAPIAEVLPARLASVEPF